MVELLDQQGRPIYVPVRIRPLSLNWFVFDNKGRPVYVPSTDPAAAQLLKPRYDKYGRPVYVPGRTCEIRSARSIILCLHRVCDYVDIRQGFGPATLLVQEGEKPRLKRGKV